MLCSGRFKKVLDKSWVSVKRMFDQYSTINGVGIACVVVFDEMLFFFFQAEDGIRDSP